MSPLPELADPNADLGSRDRETVEECLISQDKAMGAKQGQWAASPVGRQMRQQRRNRLVQKRLHKKREARESENINYMHKKRLTNELLMVWRFRHRG